MIEPPILELLADRPDLGSVKEKLAGGFSDSHVFLIETNSGLKVLKIQKDPRELAFYKDFIPKFLPNAEWLIAVFDYGYLAEWNWLTMELIPEKMPRAQWNFNLDALNILKQLHAVSVAESTFDWADSSWTEEQHEISKKYLPGSTNIKLDKIYGMYKRIATQNVVLCSGDANIPNWVVRPNGQLVLIDWQIVTRANKALDIAGWLATLLEYEDIVEVAKLYLGDAKNEEAITLAREIAVFFCKRCTTNFWRSEISEKPELWHDGTQRMIRDLPDWIDALTKKLDVN